MPPRLLRFIKPVADPVLTLVYWAYFTLGFICFFSPFYAGAAIFSRDREAAFQKLNHRFYQGFFSLMKAVTPGLSITVAEDVRAIRSSVIVCNHISYLDPILLISLFEKQKTVVKSVFFRTPIFKRVIGAAGYIPSETGGDFDTIMIRQMEGMPEFLEKGGVLFVFPEGTRSRDRRIGAFNKGAFKIARKCGAPIQVLGIRGTDRLFQPGRFRFHTCIPVHIEVTKLATLQPEYGKPGFSLKALMEEVRQMMENAAEYPDAGDGK